MVTTERKATACPDNHALSAILLLHREVPGFADLGMEAIYEFDVVDMPVPVAVDAGGTSVHNTGPAEWQSGLQRGTFNAEII